jgi:hypothetical protein
MAPHERRIGSLPSHLLVLGAKIPDTNVFLDLGQMLDSLVVYVSF